MQFIRDLENITGKRVLVRVDFNVSFDKKGRILDDFRIRQTIPTIYFLLKKGAQIILITHLGKDGSASLDPVIKRFFKISKFPKEKVSFLENIRKFPGEMTNDDEFSRFLAEKGDLYVNEAFSVSHREHASVVGIPKYLPSYAGFQLEAEIKNLSLVLKNQVHRFLFILGGAKFSTKLPLIKKYLEIADNVFIGGALLNVLLKAKGYEVGTSLVEEMPEIQEFLENKKIIWPIDVRVRSGFFIKNKKIDSLTKEDYILDIGKETTKNLFSYIENAQQILWNGPLGRYEDGGARATKKILKAVSRSSAKTTIGGGDIVSILDKMKLMKKIGFISTGGGATLDFLTSGTLPGIKVLG